jgi:hypothetical protein
MLNQHKKFGPAWRLAGALPAHRRKAWRNELARLDMLSRRERVSGEGEPWHEDLELANKLERAYDAIAAEVKNVANGAVDVAKAGAGLAKGAVDAAADTAEKVVKAAVSPLMPVLMVAAGVAVVVLLQKHAK